MIKFTKSLMFAIALAGAAFGAIPAFAVQDCELNGAYVNPANGNTTAGKTGIMKCKDRESGILMREEELRAGVFVGLVRYYKDGVLSKEYSVNERGNVNGKLREFAPNGQVLREENHVNGEVRGVVREWYPDGSLKRVAFLDDNSREKALARYNRDKQLSDLRCGDRVLLAPHVNDAALCGFQGKPSVVQLFSDHGKLNGQLTLLTGVGQQAIYYYENGKPETVEEVNARQKLRKQYSDKGVLRKESAWNISEKPAAIEREVEYHESGPKVREQIFALMDKDGRRQNRLVSDSSFYLNGQPKSGDRFMLEGKDEIRESKHYFDNGQMSSLERFVEEGNYRERAVGIHQEFAQNGQLVRERYYDDRGHVQRERTWDDHGKALKDDLVYEDGSRKAYSK